MDKKSVKKIYINNIPIKCELCHKLEDIKNGMMYKTFNENFNGMLFKLNDNHGCFWTKNCVIPLDIIFIDDNKITKIHHNCEPCINDPSYCNRYCGLGNYVLEVDGGFCLKNKISEGNTINLDPHL